MTTPRVLTAREIEDLNNNFLTADFEAYWALLRFHGDSIVITLRAYAAVVSAARERDKAESAMLAEEYAEPYEVLRDRVVAADAKLKSELAAIPEEPQ